MQGGIRTLRAHRGAALPDRWVVAATLCGWLVVSEAAAAEPGATATEQIGPLAVSVDGRARVRGDRVDGASIHAAWIAGPYLVDQAGRDALAAFERATFPEHPASGHRVVAQEPEVWMQDLQRPQVASRWTRRLIEYLLYFKDNPKGQALMRGWLRRLGRYEVPLAAILAEHDVPGDLLFVALAESGFNPAVRSRVGAAGLWQFMEATGAVYGLRTSYWVDDRHDPVKSTHAAALYLKDLKTRFGTWELALAAYNAGYGLVMTSIERANTNDFWLIADLESGLPYATVNYVPKITAAAFVGENRAAFGFGPSELTPDPTFEWTEVRAPRATSLERIAKLIDADPPTVAELNAQLIRGRTPPGRGTFPIRIPRDKVDAFERAYGTLAEEADTTTSYRVRHGERLGDIATRHGLTERELRTLNGVRDSAEIRGGVMVIVPRIDRLAERPAAEPRPVPVAALPPLTPPTGTRRVLFETTRATLPADLTKAFGATWSQVVQWNDLDPHARLQGGEVIQLLVPRDFDAGRSGVILIDTAVEVVRGSRAHLDHNLGVRGLSRRGYQARRGDTLDKIARRFDLTVGDLARINGFARGHEVEAGELLVVYVPAAKEGGTVRAPDPPEVYPTYVAAVPSTAATGKTPTRSRPAAPAVPTPSTPADVRPPSTADSNRRPGQPR
jgi:membrane-bound lytic murein transglycosylase D